MDMNARTRLWLTIIPECYDGNCTALNGYVSPGTA